MFGDCGPPNQRATFYFMNDNELWVPTFIKAPSECVIPWNIRYVKSKRPIYRCNFCNTFTKVTPWFMSFLTGPGTNGFYCRKCNKKAVRFMEWSDIHGKYVKIT